MIRREAGVVVVRADEQMRGPGVGYPSGQREQTVNLPAKAFEGSNPSPTTRMLSQMGASGWARWNEHAGVAQLVERKPSKLDVAGSSPVSRSVRPPLGPARRLSACHAGVVRGRVGAGSNGERTMRARVGTDGRSSRQQDDEGVRIARVAQLVEHTLGKGEVTGSIPVASSVGHWRPLRGRGRWQVAGGRWPMADGRWQLLNGRGIRDRP